MRRRAPADEPTRPAHSPVAHRLEQVREVAGVVNASSDLNAILDQIVIATCRHGSWWTSGIMAVNRASGFSELVARHAPVDAVEGSLPVRWPLDTSPSRLVVERRQPIIIPDAQTSTEYPAYRADAVVRKYRTVVVLSLNATDAQGSELALAVHSRERIEVDKEELDFLVTISHLAAIAVTKAKLVQAERANGARLHGIIDLGATLFGRVLAGASTETIAAAIETALRQPLIVLDFINDQIFSGRSPEPASLTDRAWAEHVASRLKRDLAALVRNTAPSEFRLLHDLALDLGTGPVARPVHVEPVRIDDETVGGLVLFPNAGPLTDLDLLVAQNAVFVLGAQLLRSHATLRQHSAQVSDLLQRLVQGAWTSDPAFQGRATQLGWNFGERSQLFLVAPTDHGGAGDDSADALPRGPPRSLEQAVRRVCPGASVGALAQTYLVRIPCDRPEGLSKTSRDRLVAATEHAMRWETGRQARVVEGPVVDALRAYPGALDTCRRLLALAQMFDRTGLVRADDFGPFALLISSLDDTAVPGFLAHTVGAVQAYDEKHGTELLRTAAVFLNESCRYQAAANRLGVHVSTLRYRLGRLRELFRIDLGDPEARFALSLAIRLSSIHRGAAPETRPACSSGTRGGRA